MDFMDGFIGVIMFFVMLAVMGILGVGPLLLAMAFSNWWLLLYLITLPTIGGLLAPVL